MQITSKILKKAHKMTKEIKAEYSEVNYKFQLGICISYLLNNREEIEMVELVGTEKQIKWAKDIIEKWSAGVDEKATSMDMRGQRTVEKEEIVSELDLYISEHNKATFYIDNRYKSNSDLTALLAERIVNKKILSEVTAKYGKLDNDNLDSRLMQKDTDLEFLCEVFDIACTDYLDANLEEVYEILG